jgi:hypothetical protein
MDTVLLTWRAIKICGEVSACPRRPKVDWLASSWGIAEVGTQPLGVCVALRQCLPPGSVSIRCNEVTCVKIDTVGTGLCTLLEGWPRKLLQPCPIEITAEPAATNGAAEQGYRSSRG